MAVGADIALAHIDHIGTAIIGTEMVQYVDLTAASSRHDDVRWGALTGAQASQCGSKAQGVKYTAAEHTSPVRPLSMSWALLKAKRSWRQWAGAMGGGTDASVR
jgi:hypothetical protein